MNFNATKTIYTQIVNNINQQICRGELKPGQKISSVRELAIKFKVNPNTIQRALSELESSGILYTERTTRRFITHDVSLIEQLHKNTTD